MNKTYLRDLGGQEGREIFTLEQHFLPLGVHHDERRQQKRGFVGGNGLTLAMVDERMQGSERRLGLGCAASPGLGAPLENFRILASTLSNEDGQPNFREIFVIDQENVTILELQDCFLIISLYFRK